MRENKIKDYSRKDNSFFFIIGRIIAIIFLLWAVPNRLHYSEYYTLLRYAVGGTALYGWVIAVELKKINWAWCFGIIAILFNFIHPLHLSKEIWQILDVIGAIVFGISFFSIKRDGIDEIEWYKDK